MHELRDAKEPSLDYLPDRMQDRDLVVVEGFKREGFPTLEVWRAAVGKPMLAPDWPGIVAIASDTPDPPPTLPLAWLDLAETACIASFVLSHAAVR